VDTALANRVVKEALETGQIPEFAAYDRVRPEQNYGTGSRVDFLLSGAALPDAYVEVKSVTLLRRPGLAEFPDSVTARGARHLGELAEMARAGHRAVLLYLVQRTDAQAVTVAEDIDPTYAAALLEAQAAGVTVLSYRANITPQEVTIGHSLPLADDRPLVLSRK
jgi:sugar fermentation stimulation protein A